MTRLPMLDPLAEIRKIYFSTTRATIDRDFEKALLLLKAMGSDEERSRATVFMHGLAQMRGDWGRGDRNGTGGPPVAGPKPRPKR